jgi:hypothetical protein
VFEDENPNGSGWEAELQQRVSELLSARLDPLTTELERLQTVVTEAQTRLQAQAQTSVTAEETIALTTQVKTLLDASISNAEQQFQARLDAEVEKQRAELRQQLEAEFQTRLAQSEAAAQAAVETEAEQFRAQIAALTANQTASANTVTVTAPPNYSLLKTAVEEIDAQRTQSETLTALITRAAHFSPRVVFYVVKSGEAVGWKAIGFENGLSDETARSLAVSIQTPSLLGQALTEQHTAIALNPAQADLAPVLGRFSHPVPAGGVAVPLVVRGKAAAVLYADSGNESDDAVHLEALEILVHTASMAIELLPVRRNAGDVVRSQPTVQPNAQPASVQPAPVQPAVQPNVAAAPVEAPASVAEPAQPAAVEEPPTPVWGNPALAQPAQEPAPANYAAPYAGDPTTTRPEEEQAQPQPVESTAADEYIAQAQYVQPVTAEEPVQPEPVPAPPEPAYFEPPAPAYVEPPAPAFQAITPEPEPDAPSIFDLVRGNAAEPPTPAPPPPTPFSNYVAPESPAIGLGGNAGQPSGTQLPDWMQRLQDDEPTEETPRFAITNPAFESAEEAFTPVSPAPPPPAPPTPPPVRIPSLSEYANRPEEADTERLPTPAPTLPPPIAPFQADAPSVRFSFNQPSEPPRYAAPSLSVTNAATETEVRAHNDARRFARLLVSEIKLYNAAKVNEGRRQADLYDRLRDEIDRSRKVYDKRVSPAVATKFDYFYDELVQTLAEGDPSKLGENCPGPVMVGQ